MDILDQKTKALITAVGESPVVVDTKSYNNEARSLLYTLIKGKVVTSTIDCNNISNLIARGKKLKSNSLSRSLQWTDITLTDSDFKVQDNSIKTAFDNLKKSAFVKISAGSVFDADKDPDNHWQDSEMYFYDMLHKYVLNQNCPHIATLLYKKVCPAKDIIDFSKINISDGSKDSQLTINDYFENMIISSVGEIIGNMEINCRGCPDLNKIFDSMLVKFKDKKVLKEDYVTDIAVLKQSVKELDSTIIQVINTVYAQKFRSIVKPGSLVAKYNILITELMVAKPLSDFIKDLIETEPKKFKEDIDSILLQLFYTLNFFNSIGFVHNDLHLGNIMIEDLGDKTTDFYYVVDGHIVPLKTKYFVRVYDFDRSYLNKDDEYGVNKRTEHQKFEFEEEYKADHTADTNSVLDYFYVMRWIEHDMLQLNINLSKDDSNKRNNVNYLYKIITETLRFEEDISYSIFFGTDINTPDVIQSSTYLIKTPNDPDNNDNTDIISKKKPTEWLSIMNQYMLKIKGDTVKDLLITPSSEIFFIANADGTPPNLLVDAIKNNEGWKKLTQNQKLIVCSPLLNIQSGGNIYLHKYLKYKAKYLQAKQRHY